MSSIPPEVIQEFKAGKIASTQRYLAEVLTLEPDNEDAWLLLGSALKANKRSYCMRQVLRINPDNQQALKAREGQDLNLDELSNVLVITEDERNADSESDPGVHYWFKFLGSDSKLIILDEAQLHLTDVQQKRHQSIVEQLEKGVLPEDYIGNHKVVDLDSIFEVTQNQSRVNIMYQEGNKQSLWFKCADDVIAVAVLNALARMLGPRFERRTEAIKNNAKIVGGFIFFILFAALTLVLLFSTFEVATGNLSLPISERAANDIGTYGPILILAIGGILMLVTFVYMIAQYLRPPKMIKLVLDDTIMQK